jgi:hypothetical protein
VLSAVRLVRCRARPLVPCFDVRTCQVGDFDRAELGLYPFLDDAVDLHRGARGCCDMLGDIAIGDRSDGVLTPRRRGSSSLPARTNEIKRLAHSQSTARTKRQRLLKDLRSPHRHCGHSRTRRPGPVRGWHSRRLSRIRRVELSEQPRQAKTSASSSGPLRCQRGRGGLNFRPHR